VYYPVFREHFGELQDLAWMGRTQGAPKDELAPAVAAEEVGSCNSVPVVPASERL
jgi:hypothetical protein